MAVDAGSNATKYRVWEIAESGHAQPLAERRFPVRLGERVFTTGLLTAESIAGTVEAFRSIRKDCDAHGIHTVRAVTTSAAREASNRLTLVREVHRATGISLEILPDAEEARMIALGILGARPGLSGPCLMIDIGGGSTEIVLARDMDIVRALSLRLGAVRMKETFLDRLPPTDEQLELLEKTIHDVIDRMLDLPTLGPEVEILGSAGTITALKAMVARAEGLDSSDAVLSLGQVETIVERVRPLTIEAICGSFSIEAARAELILAGALVLRALMRRLGVERLSCVRGGVGDGLLQNLLERLGVRHSHLFDRERALLNCAAALNDHFHVNRHHSEQVARLATSLFDQLAPLHGLGRGDRILLQAAAMVHDIGQFISFSDHHKHAQYILMHSDLPGLTESEKNVMACVARYHRKAFPKSRHIGYISLSREDRERVRRLAAILRIADGLDREQQSLVNRVRVKVGPNLVRFYLNMNFRAPIEIWYATQKGTLFAEVFARNIEFITE